MSPTVRTDVWPSTRVLAVRAPWLASVAMLLLAVLLGVYADVGQRVTGVLGTVPALGTPWLLLAFVGGLIWAPRSVVAALSGPVLIVLGLCSYWTFVEVVHGTPTYNMTNDGRGLFWLVAATVLGAAGSVAGAVAGSQRRSLRPVGWGFAVAVPLAEAVRVIFFGLSPEPPILAVCLVLAAALLLTASARVCAWWLTVFVALGYAAVGAAAATLLLPALR